MIYYFSGTGNSRYVACHLAEALGERLSRLPFSADEPAEDEAVGLVFPAYAWGIPKTIEDFIRNHASSRLKGWLYAVITCGDDVGYADRVLDKALWRACGRRLDAAFSVQMPNTYVCLPGFDVDSPELTEAKLAGAEHRVRDIAARIGKREPVRHLVRGGFPWTKTYVLRPLFKRFLLTDRYFHVSTSCCTSCGKCQKACPVDNIRIIGGTPQWQSCCAGCLACYHACPQHAIAFGSMTQKKGQYLLQAFRPATDDRLQKTLLRGH